MSITDQIKQWKGESQAVEYPNGTMVQTDDLKALATSHTSLLEAAKFLRDLLPLATVEMYLPGLPRVIQDAEKL